MSLWTRMELVPTQGQPLLFALLNIRYSNGWESTYKGFMAWRWLNADYIIQFELKR